MYQHPVYNISQKAPADIPKERREAVIYNLPATGLHLGGEIVPRGASGTDYISRH